LHKKEESPEVMVQKKVNPQIKITGPSGSKKTGAVGADET